MADQNRKSKPDQNDTSEIARNVPDNPNATICCVNNQSLTFVARSEGDFEVTKTFMDMDVPVDKPATLSTDNTFEFIRKFAEGGFGEVWQGSQNSLGRTIAIKRLRKEIYLETKHDLTTQRFYEESFLREAIVTARLEHPNIVPIYDFGLDRDGKPLIAMKLVNGKPWGELIKADRPKGIDDFLLIHLPILISVCQAVAFAHSKGILHRDLKPSQVMVGEFNEVLLMDWGLALVYDETHITKGSVKGAGMVTLATKETSGNPAGTIAFMAPEQTLEHGEELGPWTDIYLLGGMLYFLLTGFPPHHSPESSAAFLHAKMGYVEPPGELVKNRPIPLDLAEIAMKAMAPEKEDRLKTVHDLIFALERFLVSANHRKQSRDLIREAEEQFEEAGSSYARIGQSLALVERAVGLWSANPSGAPLKQKIYKSFTELALKNHDLIMARTQVEQMAESPEKTLLTAKVASTLRRNKIQNISLRIFMIFTIVALLGVSILSASLNESQARASAAQEESDKKAQETAKAGRRAEALVYFLVDDLSRELSTLYRLDLLDKIATQAMAYYESTNTENAEMTQDDLLNRAKLYRIVGDIRSLQGRLEPAKVAYQSAQESFSTLLSKNSQDPEIVQSVAELNFKQAQALIVGQEIVQGETALSAAKSSMIDLKAIFSKSGSSSDNSQNNINELEASMQQLEALLVYAKGQGGVALQRQKLAEQSLQGILVDSQTPDLLRKSLIRLSVKRSFFHRELGDLAEAESALKVGWQQLDLLISSGIRDAGINHLEAELLLENAWIDFLYGRLQSAEGGLVRAAAMTKTLVAQDALNFNWKETRANVLNLLGFVYAQNKKLALAEEASTEGLALLRTMVELEPKDLRRTLQLVGALHGGAEVQDRSGKTSQGLTYLKEAETLLTSLNQQESPFVLWNVWLCENHLLQSKLLASSNQLADSREQLVAAKERLAKLNEVDFFALKILPLEISLQEATLFAKLDNAGAGKPALEKALSEMPKSTALARVIKSKAQALEALGRNDAAAPLKAELGARLAQ